jgi:hypothetical protein
MTTSNNIGNLFEQNSSVVWMFLLRLTDGNGETIYLVNNNEEVVSKGKTYIPFPFEVTLPADDGTKLPSLSISFANFADEIVTAIRGWITPPTIDIELVTSKYPDIIEKSLIGMTLRGITFDALTVSGTLEVKDILNSKFPSETYSPTRFPSLFR